MLAGHLARLKRQGAVRRYAIDPDALRNYLASSVRGQQLPVRLREQQNRLQGIPGFAQHIAPVMQGEEGSDAAVAMLLDMLQEHGGVDLGQEGHPLIYLARALQQIHGPLRDRGQDVSQLFSTHNLLGRENTLALNQQYRQGAGGYPALGPQVAELINHIRGDQDLRRGLPREVVSRLRQTHAGIYALPRPALLADLYDTADALHQHPLADEDVGLDHLAHGVRHYTGSMLDDMNRRLLGNIH